MSETAILARRKRTRAIDMKRLLTDAELATVARELRERAGDSQTTAGKHVDRSLRQVQYAEQGTAPDTALLLIGHYAKTTPARLYEIDFPAGQIDLARRFGRGV